jgi:outer membrane protein assembly factor BamB
MTRLVPALVLLVSPGLVSADNWPQWRGPTNNGLAEAKDVPAEWDDTKNVVWKLPMPGIGASTPCVWGDRLFLSSEDGPAVVALCVSTAGKELWKVRIGTAPGKASGKRRINPEAHGATASPSTDGKHVWFFAGSGEVVCLDVDGKEKWKFNAQERYGRFEIQFGMHTTPALHQGKLYWQLMHDDAQLVLCLDAATGNEVWKVDRPSDGRAENLHSYASPFVWNTPAGSVLVTHGNDYTIGHDLTDGKELWRVRDLNGRVKKYDPTLRFVASPVCTPDLLVIPTAKNGPVVGLKPTARGKIETGSEHEAWRRASGTPDVPSPVVHDGLVYLVRERGSIQCWDAKTGKDVYEPQRLHNNIHRASPVYADGKVFATSRDGVVSVVKAGPKFELLAQNRLPDDLAASPVILDGRIYLRGFKHLYAIGTK